MIYRLALVLCFVAGVASHLRAYAAAESPSGCDKSVKIVLSRSASELPVKPSETENTTQIGVAHHAATSATTIAMIASMLVIAYAFSSENQNKTRPTRAEGIIYLKVLFRSLISRQGP